MGWVWVCAGGSLIGVGMDSGVSGGCVGVCNGVSGVGVYREITGGGGCVQWGQ